MKKFTSTIIIIKEGRWFVAKSAELGVASQGRSIDEAKKNLQEAIELYLEDMPKAVKMLNTQAALITSLEVRA